MGVWKIVFAAAAAFNLAVGLPLLLAPAALYASLGQPPPADLLMAQTAGLLIAVFGIGYGMAARDPAWARPVIWLGVIGKAPLPVLVWLNVRAGQAPMNSFWLSLGDLLFAALFLVYLLRSRRA